MAQKCAENAHNIYSTDHKAVAGKDSWHEQDLTQLSQMRGFLPNDHMIIKVFRSNRECSELYCLLTTCTVDGQLFHWVFATPRNFV